MSNEPAFGKLVTSDNLERDAIHIATIVLTACDKFNPGEPITIEEGTHNAVSCNSMDEAIGIVDPFLTKKVVKGDKFWVFLKPNTVTGMRHHFQHPAFPDNINKEEKLNKNDINNKFDYTKNKSKEWIENFCKYYYLNFDELLHSLQNNGEICAREEWDYDEYDVDTLWHHVEIYLGRKFSDSERDDVVWRCSC